MEEFTLICIVSKHAKIYLEVPISFCLNDPSVWGCRWWQQKPTGSSSSSSFHSNPRGQKLTSSPSSLSPAGGPCRRRLKCRLISTWTLNDSSSVVDISGRLIHLFNVSLPLSQVIPLGSEEGTDEEIHNGRNKCPHCTRIEIEFGSGLAGFYDIADKF